jgi:hypothetical protein
MLRFCIVADAIARAPQKPEEHKERKEDAAGGSRGFLTGHRPPPITGHFSFFAW